MCRNALKQKRATIALVVLLLSMQTTIRMSGQRTKFEEDLRGICILDHHCLAAGPFKSIMQRYKAPLKRAGLMTVASAKLLCI